MVARLTTRRLILASSLALAGYLTACSSSSSDVVATTSVDITPTLGIVYSGTVNAYSASGTLLGTGSTGTSGKATIAMTGYTANQPVIFQLVLTPGATTYFNEKTGAVASVATTSYLTSVVPYVTSGAVAGITPATNLAAKIAGVDISQVGGKLATGVASLTSDNILKAVVITNRLLSLPDDTNLLAPPVPATLASPNGGDTYGKILAAMAKNTTAADPIAQAAALASAITVSTAGAVATVTSSAFTAINSILTNAANGVNSLLTYTSSANLTTALGSVTTLSTVTTAQTNALSTKVALTAASGSGSGSSSGSGVSASSSF